MVDVPSDAALKTMNFVHRGILAITRGRLGWVVARMPVVKLITVGRHSGRERQVILTSPYQNSQFILVVASRGGDDRHPDWYLNILANANISIIDASGVKKPMIASVPDQNQYAELWELVVGKYPRYSDYQKKTERQIPLVLLKGPQT